MWNSARRRAAQKGIAFELADPRDIVIPDRCPVLNTPLAPGNRKDNKHSPSLDRIDSNKGYTLNNIRVISKRANLLKSDATFEEMRKVFNDMCRLYGMPEYQAQPVVSRRNRNRRADQPAKA